MRLHQRDHRLLEMRVEADQRFVEQQQTWARRAAPAPAGTAAVRRPRAATNGRPASASASTAVDRPLDFFAAAAAEQRHPPALAAASALATKSQPRTAQIGDRSALLRQIAGRAVAAPGRRAEYPDAAGGRPDQAQQRVQQRRLARAVGTEHADELARADPRVDIGENDAPPRGQASPGRARSRIPLTGERAVERVELRAHPLLIILSLGLGLGRRRRPAMPAFVRDRAHPLGQPRRWSGCCRTAP